jgi:hypothetical protein
MDKTLIVVLSDPKSGSEEALGRVFNALAMAYDLQERGREVALVFQGTGTRWIGELRKPTHPAHALYVEVARRIDGVCGGCADIFGAAEEAQEAHLPLLRDVKIPGTGGLTSLGRYLEDGYRLVTF